MTFKPATGPSGIGVEDASGDRVQHLLHNLEGGGHLIARVANHGKIADLRMSPQESPDAMLNSSLSQPGKVGILEGMAANILDVIRGIADMPNEQLPTKHPHF